MLPQSQGAAVFPSSFWSKAKIRLEKAGCWGLASTSAWMGLGCSPGNLALTLCRQRRCQPGAVPPESGPVLALGAGWGCPPLHVLSPANSKQVEAGASRASGGLPVVPPASSEGGRARGAAEPQGRGPPGVGRAGIGSESQHRARATGSSCAGNRSPSKVARQVWGTKVAPGCLEPSPLQAPKGRGRMDGICKLLGLRTALLTAQANLRAQVRAS